MGDVSSVLSSISNLCIAGGGVCGVAALIMYAIGKFNPQASDGISEGKMMGLVLGAIAFFAAAGLVTQIATF